MAQIGTIKLQTQSNGAVDVPVFDTGDSGSDIYEFVRVQTGSGTGFIPVEDTSNATYPYLRVQSQSHGTVAMTDRNSAIADNAIHQWKFDEGSGSTASDSIGSNNVSLTSSSVWESDSTATGGSKLDLANEYAQGNTMSGIRQDTDYSVGITINPDSLSQTNAIFSQSTNGGDERFAIGVDGGDKEVFAERWNNGTYLDSTQLDGTSEANRFRLFVAWDSSNQTFTLFKNGSKSSRTGNNIGNLIGDNVTFVIGVNTGLDGRFSGKVDNVIIYNKAGGSSLASSDYNIQPWS